MIRKAHFAVGICFVVVFLATGVFMAFTFPEPHRDDLGKRMMFRSAHLYILLTALGNLLLGAYFQARADLHMRRIQLAGSLMLLVAPLAFTVAFFTEPGVDKVERPICLAGAFLTFLGAVFLTFGQLKNRPKPQ